MGNFPPETAAFPSSHQSFVFFLRPLLYLAAADARRTTLFLIVAVFGFLVNLRFSNANGFVGTPLLKSIRQIFFQMRMNPCRFSEIVRSDFQG